MNIRDRINLPVQLQRLKELNHDTAGANFHFSYSVKTQEWVLRLTSKQMYFKHIVPEFAIMNACDWIVSNRVMGGKMGKYTLFKTTGTEAGEK